MVMVRMAAPFRVRVVRAGPGVLCQPWPRAVLDDELDNEGAADADKVGDVSDEEGGPFDVGSDLRLGRVAAKDHRGTQTTQTTSRLCAGPRRPLPRRLRPSARLNEVIIVGKRCDNRATTSRSDGGGAGTVRVRGRVAGLSVLSPTATANSSAGQAGCRSIPRTL